MIGIKNNNNKLINLCFFTGALRNGITHDQITLNLTPPLCVVLLKSLKEKVHVWLLKTNIILTTDLVTSIWRAFDSVKPCRKRLPLK